MAATDDEQHAANVALVKEHVRVKVRCGGEQVTKRRALLYVLLPLLLLATATLGLVRAARCCK